MINTIEELASIVPSLKDRGMITVLCHGVFDILHPYHIHHLKQAKAMGDRLIVTITPDEYVNKGFGHPVHNHNLRAEAMEMLRCVDYVAINEWTTATETIERIKPDIYVKGPDYKDVGGDIDKERQAVELVGGRIAFTEGVKGSSSSLAKHLIFSEDVRQYLTWFPYSTNEVLKYLDSDLKVLVVGETIIDEYQYCTALGVSAKEPILAVKKLHSEQFDGGILAVQKHLNGFCNTVDRVTSSPITKRRFVENYLFQKLFEVYEFDGGNRNLTYYLKNISDYDIVVVVDYGHGLIGKEAVDILCEQSQFLAVSVQSNAGNKGFNTISKYPRADFVCLNKHELMLEERSQGKVEDLILSLVGKYDYEKILVTCGKDGIVGYDGEFTEVPAFTQTVVDRMGTGDAVLALTALCVAQQAPMEIVGFIGNAVGAQAAQIVGNRTPIEKEPLFKFIGSLID